MKLSELGEFGLIERIAAKAGREDGLRIGIGDDAAATEPTPGCLTLTTSDMLVEGVHFDLSFCAPQTLGRKSLAVNLSDIAAMGAKPRWFLLSLAIPPSLSVEFLDRFTAGALEMAAEFGVTLIGGDTCSSKGGLVISITAMGEQKPERIAARSGAKEGDLIFVTGALGDSALGLELLRMGKPDGEGVKRHLDPTPRVKEALILSERGIPTAMIDVSDGLLADLGHILEMSGKGALLRLEALPLSPFFREMAVKSHDDPYRLPLSGGEDYELIFTAPPAREEEILSLFGKGSIPVSRIGVITPGKGITLLSPDGSPYHPGKQGYNHFIAGN